MATKKEYRVSTPGVVNGKLVINNAGQLQPNCVDPTMVQTVAVALTAAQLIAMYTTPIQIIAPVVGQTIVIDSLIFDITRTATAFTGGGVVDLQYLNTANGAGQTLHADIAATVVTGAAGETITRRDPSDLSDLAVANVKGAGVFLSNKTAAFAAGTGTAVLTVLYHMV